MLGLLDVVVVFDDQVLVLFYNEHFVEQEQVLVVV
jgi:hypothetical protein